MRTRGWVAIGIGGAVAIAAAAGYWWATGGTDAARETPAWLTERPIAHRGLHTGDSVRPENSLAAFTAAADAGYAIELDVLLTSDGTLVVIHDENLSRMTGVDKEVSKTPITEVTALRLLESTETVPTLTDVLDAVGGRVPVFVEVKNPGAVGALEDAVAETLSKASGPVAVMSFNPLSLARVAEKAPRVPRGQLSGTFEGEDLAWWKKLLLGNWLLNWKSRPDFVAYDLKELPTLGTTLQRWRGRPLVGWTPETPEQYRAAEERVDAVIADPGALP
jgi:glycerophosphoryl diester phosphodiesterase